MPAPTRTTKSPFSVRLYAMPTRGAKSPYVVLQIGDPEGARAMFAGVSTFSHAATVVPPKALGAGLSSQRRPYTSVSRETRSSCPVHRETAIAPGFERAYSLR